jgi:hypothetical protein
MDPMKLSHTADQLQLLLSQEESRRLSELLDVSPASLARDRRKLGIRRFLVWLCLVITLLFTTPLLE